MPTAMAFAASSTASRRGLLVAPRRDVQPWPSFLDPQALPATLRDLLRAVQAARRDIASAGEDWQRLAGAVPHLPALWTAASADERLRFIRHLRPYWELGLHRAAPSPTPGCRMRAAPAASAIRRPRAAPVVRRRWPRRGQLARARRIASADPAGGPRIQHARFRVRLDPHRRRAAAQSAGQGPGRAARNRFRHRRGPATGEVAQRHGQRPGLYAVGHPCAACPGNPTPSASRSPAPPRP